MNGVCNSTIYLAPPPEEGPNGKISLNFNYKVNFKDFLNQTVCVYSQIKDIKHIRRDFHSVAWGYCQNLFCSEIQPNLVC